MEPSIFEGLLDPPPGYTPEDMEVASPHTFFGEQQVSPDVERVRRQNKLLQKAATAKRLIDDEERMAMENYAKESMQLLGDFQNELRTTREDIFAELEKPLPKRQPIQLTEGEKIAAGIGALIDPQSAGRTIQEVYGQAEKRNAEEYELALKEDEIRRRNLMMELESEGDLLSAKYKNAQEILTLETNATLKRIAQKTQAHEGAIQGLWEAAASGNPLGVMFAAQQLGLDPNDEDVQALVKQAQEQEALNQRARLADVQAKEQAVNVKAAQAEAYRAKALLDGAKTNTENSRKEFLDLQRSIYPFEKYAEISERWARIWKMGEDIKVDRERLRTAREKKDTRSEADIRGSINSKYDEMKLDLEKQYRDAERAAEDAQMEYATATNIGEQTVARYKILKARETARAIEDQITELEKDREADLGAVYGGTQPTGGQPAEGTTKEGVKWRVKGNPNPSGGTVNTRGFSRRIETQTNRSQQQTAELIRSRFSGVHGVTDERVLQAILANAYAESGWNPKAVGDAGDSFGLFQANTKGGMGAGHSPAKLKDPTYNIDLIAKSDVFRQFLRFAEQNPNMSARDLTYHFARIVERPAKKYLEKRRQAWDIVFG